MIDRFGDYPYEVDYLFTIAEMKVYARQSMLELIKQSKNNVSIIMSEEGTKEIDGSKVMKISNKFGRTVSLGMDGSKLKIVIQTNRLNTDEWLEIAMDMIKELKTAKK